MAFQTIVLVPEGVTLPESIPVGAGPREFTEWLLLTNPWIGTPHDFYDLPLTQAGARALVDAAYRVSLLPEEGRNLRFQIVVNDRQESNSGFLTQFSPVDITDGNALRRLAPICDSPEFSLAVEERDGRLLCNGTRHTGSFGYGVTPTVPTYIPQGHPPRLLMKVVGPGRILAYSGMFDGIELHATGLRFRAGILWQPPIRALRDEFHHHLSQQFEAATGVDAWKNLGQEPGRIFSVAITLMIGAAVEAMHGGAFVILPDDVQGVVPGKINLKYETVGVSVGDRALESLRHCYAYRSGEKFVPWGGPIGLAMAGRETLLTTCTAIGRMSAVDGCVVLDRRLSVRGFGGVIGLTNDEAAATNRTCQLRSGPAISFAEAIVQVGGTRHQSALRLCAAVPGAIAITVSQDGDVSIFSSDQSCVKAFGPVHVPAVWESM